jgi:pectate lyase
MSKFAIMSRRGVRAAGSLVVRTAIFACLILPVIGSGEARAQSLPVNISFQPASFPLQSGYLGDFGQTFANRGNGYSYGWNVDHTSRTFAYSAVPGSETVWGAGWSLIRMLPGSSTHWDIALANGAYNVTIVAAGYQCQGQLQQISAEGVLVVNGTAGWDYDTYVGGTQTVTVNDGRLTITNGPSAALNCIDYIQISAH